MFKVVPIQPRLGFITKQNYLVKIGIGDRLVMDSFIERATPLMVVWLKNLSMIARITDSVGRLCRLNTGSRFHSILIVK